MNKKVARVREMLITKAKQFKPDLIHMQIQHTTIINGDTVAKIKTALPQTIVSNWTGDVRAFVPKSYRDVARFSDYNFISSTGQLDLFKREIKKPIHYLQIGYNPKLYFTDPSPSGNYSWDCIFIGNHNPKEQYPGAADRITACTALRNRFRNRFCLYGDGWPRNLKSNGSIDQKVVSSVYHKARCLVSVSHFNDLNHYFSDRLLMCMASGRPTVQLYFPKYESYFTDKCDLVIADNVHDVVKKVEWLCANPHMADYIGESGAKKVAAEHTYFSRTKELLEIVGLK